jgi:hypothetical protein
MKGLGADIELAIQTILDGLELNLEINEIDDDKIRRAMDSKVHSFKYSKELLDKWVNSPNSPSQDKLRKYIERLVIAGDNSIDTLRKALSKKIDYSELAPERISEAVKAKSTILEYIHNLDSNLMDLRVQIEADKFSLAEREFKLGYPERFARGDFYPKENYHKKWHNEEMDAVMICPNGTKGKIIELDGLKIQLPVRPDKKDILFSDLPKKDQYWKRHEEPEGLNPESEDAFSEYIYSEFKRRREGVWFMNNGEPVYLTGDAYFALQHCKMRDDGGYMNFRHAQLNMFYFMRACFVDPRCMGQLFVKSRRTGFTYIMLAIMLNHATSTRNVNIGITSQSDEDAMKAFQKFSYMFRNLPFYFRPVVRGAADSTKRLEFALPPDKSKASKLARKNKGEDYLNTIVDYQPTKDGSYDGQKMYIYLGDEASKWKKPANYLNHWGRISPTFDEGGVVVGKAFIGSTVNPMKQGGEEFKKLYHQSLINKRDELTQRTPSGLYSYFLPAHQNMTKFTDMYGKCWEETPPKNTYNVHDQEIKSGSIAFLEARRKAKKKESDISYNEELRAFPMTVLEALRDEAKSNIFSIEKINEQLQYNETQIIIDRYVNRGNFMWKDGVKDSEVVWYPDSNGRFLVTWLPDQNLRNRKVKKNGVWHPVNAHIGCFGADTYDISGTVSGKGSKGSLHGVTGFTMDNAPSNTFFLEYINRTTTADIFFEDVLMACVFYGMPILCENNKPRLLYHFKNRGYRGFSLNRPDKPANRLSVTEREIGGIPSSSSDVITTHASMIENFIVNFVGVYDEQEETRRVREFGAMGSFYFMETLKDWLDFDINNREKHDASVSSGYALMGLNRAKLTPVPEIKPIVIGLTTYNQKGYHSSYN